MENQMINFENGLVSVKEGESLNEQKLRETKVFAKLMMAKGMKFNEVAGINDFLLSESGQFIRAELFVVGSRNQIIIDNRCFVNVKIDAQILCNSTARMYYVELIHPSINLDESEVVTFS